MRLPRIGIEIPRVGLIPSTDLRLLLTDPDTRIRPALHHPTTGTLVTLCQRHHRLKHHGGWTLTMTPTGTATWTNCIGQQYLTQPLDHRPTAA